MDSILPPNSTPLELDLETVCAGIENIPVPIRDIWSADTCPADLLPWLAWSLSIDSWKSYWPEHVKRGIINTAITIQRKKGTRQAVGDVVRSFGGELELKEWFEQTPHGAPHSFNVLLNVNQMGAQTGQFTSDIVQEIQRVKTARSYFEVQQGLSVAGYIAFSGQIRIAKFIRLEVSSV